MKPCSRCGGARHNPKQGYCQTCHTAYMRERRDETLAWAVRVDKVVVARFRHERDAQGFALARYKERAFVSLRGTSIHAG